MASRSVKSDSFFIRRSVALPADLSFVQNTIDLGAFVDALGQSVLRIHNIAISVTDGVGRAVKMGSGDTGAVQFQLTTQTQTDMVKASNKSVISTGIVYGVNTIAAAEFPQLSHDMDVLPQLWLNGYLVAVEQIYLGGSTSSDWEETMYVSIVIEASSERMTKEAGLALALSQQ